MSDQPEAVTPDAPPAPETPDAPETAAQAPAFDMDALLREYNDNVPPAEPGQQLPTLDENAEIVQDGAVIAPTNNTIALGHVIDHIQQQDADRMAEMEANDLDAVHAWGREETADFPVPDDYAEGVISSRYLNDPEFSGAWDHRYDSQEAMDLCEKHLIRTMKSIKQSASEAPDPQSTEDREAVTAAVMGATSDAPEGPPVNYADMTDADFRRTLKKNFGFTPNI